LATDVIMPALGMNQDTGRLLTWFKRQGEAVTQGEPLMEIETDKAVTEVEAPASGVLAAVSAQVGEDVPVGQAVAVILGPGEEAPVAEGRAEAGAAPAAGTAPAPGTAPGSRADPVGAAAPAAGAASAAGAAREAGAAPIARGTPADGGSSPRARVLAKERGVDLSSVTGSGPGGAVKAADVPAAPAPSASRAPSRIWAAMARRTQESWREAPHFYLEREVDAGRLQSWRAAAAKADPSVTVTDLLLRLVASVLPRHERVNSGSADVHVGLAVAVEDGLVVPVVRAAHRLSVSQITAARRDLVERAQAHRLRPEDLEGATFTLSNLGMYAVDAFSAIVDTPQAAILATGRIADRVVAVEGAPSVRPTLRMTLSFDHRAVDGARGAAFLTELGDLVEEPAALL
jgi:pyruvate dehydrogenase E2 component (dihydrolipoamide acetyltransferase)